MTIYLYGNPPEEKESAACVGMEMDVQGLKRGCRSWYEVVDQTPVPKDAPYFPLLTSHRAIEEP